MTSLRNSHVSTAAHLCAPNPSLWLTYPWSDDKKECSVLFFPFGTHQRTQLLCFLLLVLSVRHLERHRPTLLRSVLDTPQPHLYSGQITETQASNEERVPERLSQDTLPEDFTPHALEPQHSGCYLPSSSHLHACSSFLPAPLAMNSGVALAELILTRGRA